MEVNDPKCHGFILHVFKDQTNEQTKAADMLRNFSYLELHIIMKKFHKNFHKEEDITYQGI